jgi:hypothetical protein
VSPRELFTSAEARELFRRRLRYVVGRWGHAPQILAWELWNEVDLVEQPSLPDLLAWHREMAGEIDALDPWDHLISTSTGGVDSLSLLSGGETPQSRLWELDEIDFVQSHLYAIGRDAPIDFTAALPELTRRLGRFGKPILIAEAGTDFRGPAETLRADPEGDGFHDILWAGFFSGAFGSGMAWWWDNVRDPQDQYFHFGPLARLVRGVDLAGEQIGAVGADVRVDGGRALTAFVRSGRGTVLIWIKDLGHQWFAPDPIEISGAKLELRGLAAGGWIGEWLQTRSTETVAIPELHPAEGVLSIEVPTFARDIALRLERLAE